MTETHAELDRVPPHFHGAIEKVERFMERGLWSQAHDILTEVVGVLDGLRIESAYLHWLACVVHDSMGHVSEAIEHIVRARRFDPVFPRAIASERIVMDRVAALIDIAGLGDPHVLTVLAIVRRLYPTGHPALQAIDDVLARKTAVVAEPPSERAQA
ncbi:MAG: hypothetical protein ABIZ50_02080 [Solirubrobacterales bacterium]